MIFRFQVVKSLGHFSGRKFLDGTIVFTFHPGIFVEPIWVPKKSNKKQGRTPVFGAGGDGATLPGMCPIEIHDIGHDARWGSFFPVLR